MLAIDGVHLAAAACTRTGTVAASRAAEARGVAGEGWPPRNALVEGEVEERELGELGQEQWHGAKKDFLSYGISTPTHYSRRILVGDGGSGRRRGRRRAGWWLRWRRIGFRGF